MLLTPGCGSSPGRKRRLRITGDTFDVGSAGTKAGDRINGLFAATLQELGVDVTGQRPCQLTYRMNRGADRVVVLGRTVDVRPIAGTTIEVGDIDEPSRRGIGGVERMRLIRDDIAVRVEDLAVRLSDIGNSDHH
jgi:arsenate-mycothiol transferase